MRIAAHNNAVGEVRNMTCRTREAAKQNTRDMEDGYPWTWDTQWGHGVKVNNGHSMESEWGRRGEKGSSRLGGLDLKDPGERRQLYLEIAPLGLAPGRAFGSLPLRTSWVLMRATACYCAPSASLVPISSRDHRSLCSNGREMGCLHMATMATMTTTATTALLDSRRFVRTS